MILTPLDAAKQRLRAALASMETMVEARIERVRREAEETTRVQTLKQLGESRTRADALTKEVATLRERDAQLKAELTAQQKETELLIQRLKQLELVNRTLEARNAQAKTRVDALMGRLQKLLGDNVANTDTPPASPRQRKGTPS